MASPLTVLGGGSFLFSAFSVFSLFSWLQMAQGVEVFFFDLISTLEPILLLISLVSSRLVGMITKRLRSDEGPNGLDTVGHLAWNAMMGFPLKYKEWWS